jgi:hypothetical protein
MFCRLSSRLRVERRNHLDNCDASYAQAGSVIEFTKGVRGYFTVKSQVFTTPSAAR